MTAVAERTDLKELAKDGLARWNVPGMTIGILHEGQRHVHAFGTANLQTRTPVQADTLFQYGSISKVVTATAVMQLVDGWRIDLDTPVKRYLPEFALLDPEATETVTPRHLLTHMGGFWGDDFTDYGNGDDALARAVEGLQRIKQITAIGTTWAYCNTGWQVLGRLVEKFRHEPAETTFRKRVLEPIGMESTFYFADEAVTRAAAVGYNAFGNDEPRAGRPYAIARAMNPAGGCIGTAADLLEFAAFHMGLEGTAGERVLRSGARLAMQERQVKSAGMAPYWGLGWMLHDIAGEAAYGHGGSTNGFRATLLAVPGREFAVAVLTNGSQGSALYREIEAWTLKEFTSLERPTKPAVPIAASKVAEYAGRYKVPFATLDLSPADDGLRVRSETRSAIQPDEGRETTYHAVHIGNDEFRVTDTDLLGTTFDFVRDEGGAIRFLRHGGRLHEPAPGATPS